MCQRQLANGIAGCQPVGKATTHDAREHRHGDSLAEVSSTGQVSGAHDLFSRRLFQLLVVAGLANDRNSNQGRCHPGEDHEPTGRVHQ